MRYDPIMCMMIDDTVKSNDKKTVDASFNVVYKSNTGTMQALVMAASEKEAEQKVRSREGSKFVSLIGVKKMSDSNTLDKAIEVVSYNEKYDKFRLAIAIREKINEENDAINSYLSLVSHIDDYEIADVIKDIANEEKVHVGELQKILYELDPDELTKEKEGRKEND